MQRLSRRFSGFAYLYMAAAQILIAVFFSTGYGKFFTDSILENSTFFFLFFRLVIYLPPVIAIAVRRYPFSGVLRLSTFPAKQLFFAGGISLFLYLFFSIFGRALGNLLPLIFMPGFPLTVFDGGDFYIWPEIITSCLLPAILYELSFRGAVQSGLYGLRPIKACLVMGALYALMLTSVLGFLPSAILGFTLSYISIKTGSIIPGMITAFLFYLLRTINFDGLIYFGLLSPLGMSEGLSAALLAVVSAAMLVLLLKTMPDTSGNARLITVDRSKSVLQRLMALRRRLQLSWLPDPDAAQPAASSEEAVPIPAEMELKIYPDDSVKQSKNTGFIIGVIILAVVAIISFGLNMFYYITSHYFN